MQRFFRLFLLGSFFKLWAFATESQFDDIILHAWWQVFGAWFDNPLHITPFWSNKSPCNLKLFIVFNLNLKTTRVLHSFQLITLIATHLTRIVVVVLLLLLQTTCLITVRLLLIIQRHWFLLFLDSDLCWLASIIRIKRLILTYTLFISRS